MLHVKQQRGLGANDPLPDYDDGRLRAELGWRPVISAPDAIARTVAWFVTNEKPGH